LNIFTGLNKYEVPFLLQLQAQLEQIAKVNADLRRKNNTHKKQSQVLLTEKADLEVQLREKDAQVEKVKVMISEQEKFEEQRAAVRAAIAEQHESDEVRKILKK
jgi:septal ring factor EnvC (AmiA/AmiB activator)